MKQIKIHQRRGLNVPAINLTKLIIQIIKNLVYTFLGIKLYNCRYRVRAMKFWLVLQFSRLLLDHLKISPIFRFSLKMHALF